MNIALWFAQVVLGVVFVRFGFRKLLLSDHELHRQIPWTSDRPISFVRFIGLIELAGGVGVVAPSVVKVKPILTPIAGVGIAMLMVLGARLHIRRGEYAEMLSDEPLFFGLASFVVWGRLKRYPIHTHHQIKV